MGVPRRNLCKVLLLVCCFSAASADAAAGNRYERTMEKFSQTLQVYREMSRQGGKYDVAFRRDPMRALVDTQGNLLTSIGLQEGLSVQGIIWSKKHPLVVIEDELFAQGEVIDQYTIRKILPNKVVVEGGNRIQVIPIDRKIESKEKTLQQPPY